MEYSSTDLLFGILHNMRRSLPLRVNDHCIGRCPTDIGYLLREMLADYKVRVRLFPRGQGNKGMRKGLALGDSRECVVYVKGYTVKELFVKIFKTLLGVEWQNLAVTPVCDRIVINHDYIMISDAKGKVVRWSRSEWTQWPHTVPSRVHIVRAAAAGESAIKLMFGQGKDDE